MGFEDFSGPGSGATHYELAWSLNSHLHGQTEQEKISTYLLRTVTLLNDPHISAANHFSPSPLLPFYLWDRLSYTTLTLMIDSYSIHLLVKDCNSVKRSSYFCCQSFLSFTACFSLSWHSLHLTSNCLNLSLNSFI